MIFFPPCKINIGLYILNKRADGFHNLATGFYPVNALSDVLEIVPSSVFAYSASGIPVEGDTEHNLTVKAYRLMERRHACPPVSIHLHKCVPMGAGLGGGSADAAYTLLLLNDLFELHLSPLTLCEYASELGSDCAFFIQHQPAIGRGKGDELSYITLAQLQGKYIMLVKPDVHIPTADAYRNCVCRNANVDICSLLQLPLAQWQQALHNDFEDTLFPLYPALAHIKSRLLQQGAVYASLSGSGATVYGIFESAPPAMCWEPNTFVFVTKL